MHPNAAQSRPGKATVVYTALQIHKIPGGLLVNPGGRIVVGKGGCNIRFDRYQSGVGAAQKVVLGFRQNCE